MLTVIDEYTRERLTIEVDGHIRSDNGSEFTAIAVRYGNDCSGLA